MDAVDLYDGENLGDIMRDQNVHIIKLISALGNKDSGRRTILKAMPANQGISSDEDINDLMSGSAERRLHVPAYLRNVMKDIGLGEVMAPLNLSEIVGGNELLLMAGDSWSDLEFEVALESGAVVHVCSLEGHT